MTDVQPPATSGPNSGGLGEHVELHTCVADLATAVLKGMEQLLEGADINPFEYSLMLRCSQQGELTATELAAVLPVDPSRISRIVARLVDKRFLQRRRMRSDRRLVMLRLTDEGTEIIAELSDRVREFNNDLIADISSEDWRAFASVANKIIAKSGCMPD